MSSIDNAKKGMGWRNSSQRPACWNCTYATENVSPVFGTVWRCNRGGFNTNRLAICDKHQPKEEDART